MEILNYLTENSVEILRLAGAVALVAIGFFFLYLCRVVFILTRVVRKVNDLSDLFIHYVQQPISTLMKIDKMVKKFGKKKKV